MFNIGRCFSWTRVAYLYPQVTFGEPLFVSSGRPRAARVTPSRPFEDETSICASMSYLLPKNVMAFMLKVANANPRSQHHQMADHAALSWFCRGNLNLPKSPKYEPVRRC